MSGTERSLFAVVHSFEISKSTCHPERRAEPRLRGEAKSRNLVLAVSGTDAPAHVPSKMRIAPHQILRKLRMTSSWETKFTRTYYSFNKP